MPTNATPRQEQPGPGPTLDTTSPAGAPATGRWWLPFAAAALLLGAVATVLVTAPPYTKLVVDDLAQVVAPAFAALSCAQVARRRSGQGRKVWAAMALGCASWALGQTVWTVYELGLGVETPFPSLADIGFLGFPIGAGVALWSYPTAGVAGDRRRRVLDGLTITSALGLVSWATALGAVAQAGAENPLAFAIGLAYPASDLLVVAMTLVVLMHATENRPALLLIASGIGLIAVSDSVFSYLTTLETYGTGGLEGLGWMTGFVLLGLAPRVRSGGTHDSVAHDLDGEDHLPAPTASLLPYLMVGVAAATGAALVVSGRGVDVVAIALGAVILLLVLLRQYLTLRDNGRLVTALAQREAQLRHQAFHDGLTGLANRALFQDRVDHALALHRRDGRALAVLFCDLDDFKVINDTLGHAMGDELLVRVAERLRGALRAGDTLARLGGDEFVVLLEDAVSPGGIAQAMLEVLAEPFVLGGRSVIVGTSIGVTSILPGAATPTASVLLSQADTAMYAAKRDGRGLARTYEQGMTLPEVTDHERRGELADAIERRQITLAYQPIIDVASGRVTGVEALARWHNGEAGISPAEFIAVAERTDLIAPLTDLVLEIACEQLTSLQSHPEGHHLTMAVNVSPQQITDRAFPRHLQTILERHGVSPSRLTVEITETGLLTDVAAAEQVTADLAALGVRVALDDFGVGYSSLANLNRIRLHDLKIDRAFIAGMGRGQDQLRVVKAVLTLGEALGLHVVAEGVEHADQLALLHDLGCPSAQGYLLARPMTGDALATWLSTQENLTSAR